MNVFIRTTLVTLAFSAGIAIAGIPEPDVRLHGLLKLDGQQVVAGRNVTLVAELADTEQQVGRYSFADIDLNDCNVNGVPDATEIAEGATDNDGDGILDECNRFVLRMRMEASIQGESDNPNAARIGDTVRVYAIDKDHMTCDGGDRPEASCQTDVECTGDPDGTCVAPKTLVAVMGITETGLLRALDLGYCDVDGDQIPDLATSRLYVRGDAPAGGDGSSWDEALPNLSSAIAVRECIGEFVNEIWVAEGTYTPPVPDLPADPRGATFVIPIGMDIYGGFAGDETALSQRDTAAHPTILSGDLNGDDATAGKSENAYHVVTINGIATSQRMNGFVIKAGNADGTGDNAYGGGLWIKDSEITIADCSVSENSSTTGGGGAYISGGHIAWQDCSFTGNQTATDGAAVYNLSPKTSFANCRFENNSMSGTGSNRRGGAVFNSAVGIRRCFGGANDGQACCQDEDCTAGTCLGVLFTSCEFVNNRADLGGAIANIESSPIFEACTLYDNQATRGGAIYNRGDDGALAAPLLVNCQLVNNTANSWGGAICNHAYTATALTNCTLARNFSTAGTGGAIGSLNQSNNNNTLTVTNCILWGNNAAQGTLDVQQLNVTGIQAQVNYSCIQDDVTNDGTAFPGTANIDRNPLFVREPGSGDVGDLRLLMASPCCDAGNNDADIDPTYQAGVQPIPSTDFYGQDRIADNLCVADTGAPSTDHIYVDIGAYEFATPPVTGSTIYVDNDAQGQKTGANWADAIDDLQLALCMAKNSDGVVQEVWVAKGVYTATIRTDPNDPRSVAFAPVNGVAIRGGFGGYETLADQRDMVANPTILSGDINQDDSNGGTNSENAYHVVITYQGTDETAVMDGFTITGGNANSTLGGTMIGGGVLISNGDPTIINCVVKENNAALGGGLYIFGSCSPTLEHCTISHNYASSDGGGMYTRSGAAPELLHCTFLANSASLTAGAIRNQNGASPTLINCLLAGSGKEAVCNGMSAPLLVSCTIAGSEGIAMHSDSFSAPVVSNSILYANGSGSISGPATVSYSCLDGGYPGDGNIADNPLFEDADQGDYHLTNESPCINGGAIGELPAGLDTDLDGNPRVVSGAVDMGVYENQDAGNGDADGDGDVDLADFSLFFECMAGPQMQPSPAAPQTPTSCLNAFDSDGDRDIDMVDYAKLATGFVGW